MVLFRSLSIKSISHSAALCLLYNFENSFLNQDNDMDWMLLRNQEKVKHGGWEHLIKDVGVKLLLGKPGRESDTLGQTLPPPRRRKYRRPSLSNL